MEYPYSILLLLKVVPMICVIVINKIYRLKSFLFYLFDGLCTSSFLLQTLIRVRSEIVNKIIDCNG